MLKETKNLTIVCLEVPWTNHFGVNGDGFRPESSILPYAQAHFSGPDYRVFHRAVNSERDLLLWCSGIKQKHLDRRVLWISGHGAALVKSEVGLLLPDESTLKPLQIKKSIAKAGPLDGVIIDACSFGQNDHMSWLEGIDAQWALAFSKDVLWTDSMFFVLKTLDWLYGFDIAPPSSSSDFMLRFEKGIKTGRKLKAEKIDLTGWAESLGVSFYYRKKKSSWSKYDTGVAEP